MNSRPHVILFVLAFIGLFPGGRASGQTPSVISGYDLSADAGVPVALPQSLREISGLATTADGRLFGHQDERASIKELEPRTGEVLKSFSVGLTGLRGDFEGLAIVGERFFLVTSRGTLVEFREGSHGQSTGYELHSLNLDRVCEVEGLAFDQASGALLVPCKTTKHKSLDDHVAVFAVPLATLAPDPEPRVLLPLDEVDDAGFGNDFHPSAIEIHPETGSLLLLAAREEMLLELDRSGGLIDGEEFKRRNHPQPEGIAFLPDGTMVIADEGQDGYGTLTLYPPRTAGGRP
jgi:uncharacterized protein YjiK